MPKTKKVKVATEAPVDVVNVEPVVEPVVEPTKLVDAREELKRIYAASKAKNPEMYAFKNKDEDLARKLNALK